MAKKNKEKNKDSELHKVKWVKVQRPQRWPLAQGAVLVGEFLGIETCVHPEYGTYRRVLVRVPSGTVYYVSGTVLLDLISSAGLRAEEYVKIKYVETVSTVSGHGCHIFEVEVADRG